MRNHLQKKLRKYKCNRDISRFIFCQIISYFYFRSTKIFVGSHIRFVDFFLHRLLYVASIYPHQFLLNFYATYNNKENKVND
jgi:hypothetical protein